MQSSNTPDTHKTSDRPEPGSDELESVLSGGGVAGTTPTTGKPIIAERNGSDEPGILRVAGRVTPIIVGSIAIAAIVSVGGYIAITSKPTTNNASAATSQTNSSAQSSTTGSNTPAVSSSSGQAATNSSGSTAATTTASYKNGTYTATSQYSVPHGGQNSVKVTVTLTDGEITDVSTTNDYQDQESGYYIDSFESDIKAAMSGTNIGDAYAARVGGASLTSSAFNDALQTIENEAKA